jgi:hypothetical protein
LRVFLLKFSYYGLQISISKQGAIYCILLFAVLIVGIIRYRNLSLPFKILTWASISFFLISIFERYCIAKYHTNVPSSHIVAIDEYIFYSSIYYFLFRNVLIKKFILMAMVVFTIFFLINAIFLQPFFHIFPTNINALAQLLYTVFSLLLFKEMLDYPVKVNIAKQSVFWFNITILLYATTAFFLLVLTNYFSKTSNYESNLIFHLWWAIDDLVQILIGITFLTSSKENNVLEISSSAR